MKVNQSWLKKLNPTSSKKQELNCFVSIDELPIYNWEKIFETKQLKYLLKSGTIDNEDVLMPLWENIYEEFINKFGFSDKYIAILEKKKEIALLEIEMYANEDKSRGLLINLAKIELENMMLVDENKSIDSIKASMEVELGFRLNTREVTVSEFYNYINYLNGRERQNKAK